MSDVGRAEEPTSPLTPSAARSALKCPAGFRKPSLKDVGSSSSEGNLNRRPSLARRPSLGSASFSLRKNSASQLKRLSGVGKLIKGPDLLAKKRRDEANLRTDPAFYEAQRLAKLGETESGIQARLAAAIMREQAMAATPGGEAEVKIHALKRRLEKAGYEYDIDTLAKLTSLMKGAHEQHPPTWSLDRHDAPAME